MPEKNSRLGFLLLIIFLFGNDVNQGKAFKPPELRDELGCSPTLSLLLGRPEGVYFDPLNIANDSNFARLRESELKHGRIAMAANVGIILPPLKKLLVDGIGIRENFPSASIVANLKALDLNDCLNVIVTCAFLETFVFIQKDSKDMPGDYSTGYFGVRDKGLNERSLVSELENGRLAMLSITGLFVSELVTGKSWIKQWEDVFVNFLVNEYGGVFGSSNV